MKEKFSESHHKKFIKYFNMKEKPSKIELGFYKKTEKYLKYIKWIPGLRMIGIGNSVSMNCSSKNSDIDLLIVTTDKSIWLNRILITLIFTIIGIRKTKNKHAGRFCLSFFCTIEGLNFDNWKIKNDIYLYYWILYFKPILDINNTYNLFLEKNNWANFNDYQYLIKNNKKYIKYKYIKYKEINFFLILINKILKKIFIKKTLKQYKKIGTPYGIIINNNILKFHNGDIRKKIKKELVSN